MRQSLLPWSVTCLVVLSLAGAAAQQKEEDAVYEPGAGVTLPKVITEVRAQYPADAMKRRVQGAVHLECVVSREGEPTDVKVTKSLDESIDANAVEALQQWRFEPGTKDGKPVRVRIEVEMTFTVKK